MQARLQLIKLPVTFLVVVFALVAALSLGAAIGYTLKPATTVNGATHTAYDNSYGPQSDLTRALPSGQTSTPAPSSDACVWLDHKKAC